MSSQEFIQRLLSPERVEALDPLVILSFCPINVHDRVADIGCGPGFFTIPLAKFLVRGNLHALDLDEEMLSACRERVAQARMGNVEVLKCEEFEFPLKQASLDGAFVAFVVQASSDKLRFLQAIRGLIQPKGWCMVLEWYRKETTYGPPLERRVDPGELQELATQAGFKYLDHRDLNGEQYMMTLRNV